MENRGTLDGLAIRDATPADASAIARVEAAARSLLQPHGVDLDGMEVPDGFHESTAWDLALVACLKEHVVGFARCSDLGGGWLALDQVSVDPAYAQRGVGRLLLTALTVRAQQLGYLTITGTTFRDVPFYAGLYATEDPAPHPAMLERRRIEQDLGLDQLGARLIMRLTIGG